MSWRRRTFCRSRGPCGCCDGRDRSRSACPDCGPACGLIETRWKGSTQAGEKQLSIALAALDVLDEQVDGFVGGNGGELLADHRHAAELVRGLEHFVPACAGVRGA